MGASSDGLDGEGIVESWTMPPGWSVLALWPQEATLLQSTVSAPLFP